MKQPRKTSVFSLKSFSKQQWLVLILLGLLLVVIAMPVAKNSEDGTKDTGASSVFAVDTETPTQVISSELEQQLGEMLSQVEGVGQVQVMLYQKSSTNSLVSMTSFDANSGGEIGGVLIVAEGADNPVTVQKIQEAVMALFQVEAHKIKVMKMVTIQ